MEEKALFRSLLAHCKNLTESVWRGLPALPELDALFRSARTAPPRTQNPDEQAVLDELANEPDALEQGLPAAEYDVLYNAAIRFPFEHWFPSRFSDGRRYGVWHAARERRTVVRECAQGLAREWLGATNTRARGSKPAFWQKRYLVRVFCDSLLADLIHTALAIQWREALTADDHAFCQRLGTEAVHQVPGVLYASAREPGGQCLGVFNERLLSSPELVAGIDLRLNLRNSALHVTADDAQWRIPQYPTG
ncbi:MAG: RES family NAD+ phosphorylase [Nitrococcus sp.]|nr:RES family NAD+ phosphorylase [Nitrococcus sp.]